MREDPPPDTRCRDKFLVQSVAITPERDMSNIAATVSHSQSLNELCSPSVVAKCGEDFQSGYSGTKNSSRIPTFRYLFRNAKPQQCKWGCKFQRSKPCLDSNYRDSTCQMKPPLLMARLPFHLARLLQTQ